MTKKKYNILLVEDDPGDVDLTREALKEAGVVVNLHVVDNGVAALNYLRQQHPYTQALHPDLILLDLNLPRKDGREVLREVKADPSLRHIPIVILTTSESVTDIRAVYGLGGNCYVTKPIGFDEFARVVQSIEDFWLTVVKLPHDA